MSHVIHIRDVVRSGMHHLPPDQRALRVPYDMFHPKGPVIAYGPEVEWPEGKELRRARFRETVLGDCHAGERVLVRLGPEPRDDEWWLCQVLAGGD